MNRNETIIEIARVFIDALGKQVDPDDAVLVDTINDACKAHRLAHTDRYHNLIEDVARIMGFDTPDMVRDERQSGNGESKL